MRSHPSWSPQLWLWFPPGDWFTPSPCQPSGPLLSGFLLPSPPSTAFWCFSYWDPWDPGVPLRKVTDWEVVLLGPASVEKFDSTCSVCWNSVGHFPGGGAWSGCWVSLGGASSVPHLHSHLQPHSPAWPCPPLPRACPDEPPPALPPRDQHIASGFPSVAGICTALGTFQKTEMYLLLTLSPETPVTTVKFI